MTTKKEILEQAIGTVADRGVPYGGVESNFERIAAMWTTHLKNRYGADKVDFIVDAADVAMMMVAMKLARLQALPTHTDSWIDICGYGACGGEVGASMVAMQAIADAAKKAVEKPLGSLLRGVGDRPHNDATRV